MLKYMFYLKNYSRPIVITDKNNKKTEKEIINKISGLMAQEEILSFETDNDVIIIRPNDIIAVHLMQEIPRKEKVKNIEIDEFIDQELEDIDMEDLESKDIGFFAVDDKELDIVLTIDEDEEAKEEETTIKEDTVIEEEKVNNE